MKCDDCRYYNNGYYATKCKDCANKVELPDNFTPKEEFNPYKAVGLGAGAICPNCHSMVPCKCSIKPKEEKKPECFGENDTHSKLCPECKFEHDCIIETFDNPQPFPELPEIKKDEVCLVDQIFIYQKVDKIIAWCRFTEEKLKKMEDK